MGDIKDRRRIIGKDALSRDFSRRHNIGRHNREGRHVPMCSPFPSYPLEDNPTPTPLRLGLCDMSDWLESPASPLPIPPFLMATVVQPSPVSYKAREVYIVKLSSEHPCKGYKRDLAKHGDMDLLRFRGHRGKSDLSTRGGGEGLHL